MLGYEGVVSHEIFGKGAGPERRPGVVEIFLMLIIQSMTWKWSPYNDYIRKYLLDND